MSTSLKSAGSKRTIGKPKSRSLLSKTVKSEANWRVGRLAYSQALPVLDFLNLNQDEKAKILDVNPSTVSRWKSADGKLGILSSKMVYDIEELIEKGISVFGSEEKFINWLETDNYALGDDKPKELLQDPRGLELVDEALDALAWGSYI
ncbi:antitoxin Xre/MbcA/ParS toxin-binding domain-containing protein [Leeuwenhoekiella sp. A16]|uniref:antitoxin Xre/MbcA/ParS toxin-binding domain-containing protein n=1 Tax=unclassified Leeuwenhoekiella TaxID=2615029 RepID=UPI003A803CD5